MFFEGLRLLDFLTVLGIAVLLTLYSIWHFKYGEQYHFVHLFFSLCQKIYKQVFFLHQCASQMFCSPVAFVFLKAQILVESASRSLRETRT